MERKRPSVKIGSDELTQITKYAVAVGADPRFNIRDVDWDFWIVSDELDDYTTEMTNKAGLPAGQHHVSKEGNVRVWAVPWAEVIENASHRLKFVQDQLNYMVTDEAAIGYSSAPTSSSFRPASRVTRNALRVSQYDTPV